MSIIGSVATATSGQTDWLSHTPRTMAKSAATSPTTAISKPIENRRVTGIAPPAVAIRETDRRTVPGILLDSVLLIKNEVWPVLCSPTPLH